MAAIAADHTTDEGACDFLGIVFIVGFGAIGPTDVLAATAGELGAGGGWLMAVITGSGCTVCAVEAMVIFFLKIPDTHTHR